MSTLMERCTMDVLSALSTYSALRADLVLICSAKIGQALIEESRCVDVVGQRMAPLAGSFCSKSSEAC